MSRTAKMLFVFILGLAPAVPQAQDKPNVVIILVDNLGWGELGSYGGGILRGAPTPRLDKLADEGLRFPTSTWNRSVHPAGQR